MTEDVKSNNENPTATNGYFLFFRGKDWDEELSDEELQNVFNRYTAWTDALIRGGKVRGGEVLGKSAKTLVKKNGQLVSDGPFQEAKEAIGGYIYLNVDTMEEATAIATACPGLDLGGTIEIRPVLEKCPVWERAKRRLQEVAMISG